LPGQIVLVNLKNNQMKKYTVVWNNHGEGSLVGVFNNSSMIQDIKETVTKNKQETYIKFIEVELNNINEKALYTYKDDGSIYKKRDQG
jgi:hypothetical protein